MEGMTLLVTGGAGFIGSNFVHHLLERYSDIAVIDLDMLTYAVNLANLSDLEADPRHTFVRGDICDRKMVDRLFQEHRPDMVINFAAESHVDRSILEPDVFVRTNVLGAQCLLGAAREHEVERFLQVSTDEVYGSLGPEGLFTEDTPIDPSSPYSASKAGADLLALAYNRTFGSPVLITRCSNNYGPYQFPEKLIPVIIMNCLEGRPIPVYGDGMNVRDWLYVGDHCSAICRVLKRGRPGEVYNVGGNNECTNIDMVRTIIRIMADRLPDAGIDESLISFVADRKGHDRRYAIDASKIASDLGWEPTTSFERGMAETVDWSLENRGWMDSVISKDYLNYYDRNYSQR